GARYLFEEMDPRTDPFSPENRLIFATGPLTGTNASCGARYMVITKGPLTGTITTSNSGGHWGPELKFAGYDLLIVEGRAERPVRLADPAGFLRAQWALKAKVRSHPVTGEGLPTFGTDVLMNVINSVGTLPTRNFTAAQFEGADNIGGETLKETRLVNNKACF